MTDVKVTLDGKYLLSSAVDCTLCLWTLQGIFFLKTNNNY
jgi:hypothetical protein